MGTGQPAQIIAICGEKVVQRVSKGRNQWLLLKQFHGRTVGEFIEAAQAQTARSPSGTYQQGRWWDRELSYCVEKRVIRLVDGTAPSTPPTSVARTGEDRRPADKSGLMTSLLRALFGPRRARVLGNSRSPSAGRSGLYLVTLNNQQPISTNAADPRIADRCARVNREHCKFGRARDFARRRGNYEETFGAHNVNFLPLAAVAEADLAVAERCVLQQLTAYKIRGPSGYRLEWLTGVRPEQVVAIARETLRAKRITHRWLV
jgi:hypothetical protein